MSNLKVEVAVIGDGPAGSTVALTLAKLGISVALLGNTYPINWRIGECLPPATKPLLVHLGLWQKFLEDGHMPSYGNCSAWGDVNLSYTDFLFHPYGCGWHLNRVRFDRMLMDAAVWAGAFHVKSAVKVEDTYSRNSLWRLNLTKESNQVDQVSCELVVDATGRSNWFAHKQGVKRIAYDRLVGIAGLLSCADLEDSDSITMIESVQDGWWYSALIPENRRIAVFFTDSDLPSARTATTYEGWMKLVEHTIYVQKCLAKYNYRLISGLHITMASSSCLQRVIGNNWLAVGDAAAAYDPLSSQGILLALINGLEAAHVIAAYLGGKAIALQNYAEKVTGRFNNYLQKHTAYYKKEGRWKDHVFWKRHQKHELIMF